MTADPHIFVFVESSRVKIKYFPLQYRATYHLIWRLIQLVPLAERFIRPVQITIQAFKNTKGQYGEGMADMIYSPLNPNAYEIRLVQLRPGEGDQKITCRLHTVSLNREIAYEAVSYEWGLPSEDDPCILLQDIDFVVRTNLWHALCCLRRQSEARLLWIDALCIDQGNAAERKHQVAIMGNIYWTARSTVSWLGPAVKHNVQSSPTDAEVVSQFLLTPVKRFMRKSISSTSLLERNLQKRNMPDGSIAKLSKHQDKFLECLERLCHRPYWTRLWIIQEVVLARDIALQSGLHTIPWQKLQEVFRILDAIHSNGNPRVLDNHYHLMQSITKSTPFRLDCYRPSIESRHSVSPMSSSLVDLMMRFDGSECQDVRDKALGLLGLTEACCRDPMIADYPKSLTEVCNIALVHYLQKHVESNEQCQTFRKAMPIVLSMIGLNMRERIAEMRELLDADERATYQSGELGPVIWLSTPCFFPSSTKKFRSQLGESGIQVLGLKSLRIFATGDRLFGCATRKVQVGDYPRYREGRERHGILDFFREVDGNQEEVGQGFKIGGDYMTFSESLRQSSSTCAVSITRQGPDGPVQYHCQPCAVDEIRLEDHRETQWRIVMIPR